MMLKEASEIIQRILNGHQPRNLLVLALRFLWCTADNRSDARENENVIRITSERSCAGFQVLIEGLRLLHSFVTSEDSICLLGGIVLANLGSSRLEDYR